MGTTNEITLSKIKVTIPDQARVAVMASLRIFDVCAGAWARGGRPRSQCGIVCFSGADANGVIERGDKDLAIADLAGLCGLGERVDDFADLICFGGDLDPDLGQEMDTVFGAAIDLGMTLLPSVAFDLSDGHAPDADARQRAADLIKLERFDDGDNQFHSATC